MGGVADEGHCGKVLPMVALPKMVLGTANYGATGKGITKNAVANANDGVNDNGRCQQWVSWTIQM